MQVISEALYKQGIQPLPFSRHFDLVCFLDVLNLFFANILITEYTETESFSYDPQNLSQNKL